MQWSERVGDTMDGSFSIWYLRILILYFLRWLLLMSMGYSVREFLYVANEEVPKLRRYRLLYRP